ncbi:MAG TPA: MoaD/ThiS family protein [Spirochaetota bacterium]|nr:MoaD/ThiS family protein [Spirochaetota bacterium]HQO41003.1 MoaD/ThiS family protein [Spirochaetota bacterium]
MKATVKLFASLRTGRFDLSEIELVNGSSITDLLELLQIEQKEAAIIFINGVHAEYTSNIKECDQIAIFPPIGGG